MGGLFGWVGGGGGQRVCWAPSQIIGWAWPYTYDVGRWREGGEGVVRDYCMVELENFCNVKLKI